MRNTSSAVQHEHSKPDNDVCITDTVQRTSRGRANRTSVVYPPTDLHHDGAFRVDLGRHTAACTSRLYHNRNPGTTKEQGGKIRREEWFS